MGRAIAKNNERVRTALIVSTIESIVGKYLGINPSRANNR